MDPVKEFRAECDKRIAAQGENRALVDAARRFRMETINSLYTYHFTWLSRPIIQYPQDMVAVQELISSVRPDLIIETGIAHGGSLIMNASLLALLDYCDAAESGTLLDPKAPKRKIIGLDIDIRAHNRDAIEAHPMASRIEMIEGSSIDPDVIQRVHAIAGNYQRIMVFLDSNHTHDHVLAELIAYAPLVSVGSYCVVFDTVVEEVPAETYPDRPWGPGNSPKSAVREYLRRLNAGELGESPAKFTVDKRVDNQLLVSMAPDGYLHRVA
jgi:cephalosporin hydroxylase